MKALKLLAFLFVAYVPYSYSSGLYELNDGLHFDIGSPKKIRHLPPSVILTYDDMAFLHEILDAATAYDDVDLTGHLECFIRNMFNDACDRPLTASLKKLSDSKIKEQEGNIGKGILSRRSIGDSDILSMYYKSYDYGDIYVFSSGVIHHITVTRATEKKFTHFLNNIKKRSL